MRLGRTGVFCAYCGLLVFALALAAARPVAFQKLNSMVRVTEVEPLSADGEFLDFQTVLEKIPYGDASQVWSISPRERYRETILEGGGNCSNLAFGLAYLLDQRGVDFQIIHLMPRDNFLDGAGHTILRTRLRYRGMEQPAIVDVLAGGLPMTAGRPIDVDQLGGPVRDFALASFNDRKPERSPYYGRFLEDSSVGVISGREVAAYYRFLETVYVPLGNQRLEKYVYDGLALLAGRYPEIHVPVTSADPLEGRQLEVRAHQGSLWILRSTAVAFPGWILFVAFGYLGALRESLARLAASLTPRSASGHVPSALPMAK